MKVANEGVAFFESPECAEFLKRLFDAHDTHDRLKNSNWTNEDVKMVQKLALHLEIVTSVRENFCGVDKGYTLSAQQTRAEALTKTNGKLIILNPFLII